MTTGVAAPRSAAAGRPAGYRAARRRFPPRPAQQDWPATRQACEQVLQQLAGSADSAASPRGLGSIGALLDWLEDQEGGSWQASGADASGAGWLRLPAQWLHRRAQGLPARAARSSTRQQVL
jgi:hypothetical protein